MKVITTALPEVLILEPQVFGDERGFFYESFNARRFAEATGVTREFVQDNHSRSARGVLRGLPALEAHYRQGYDWADAGARGTLSFQRLDFRPLGPSHALYIGRYVLSRPGAPAVSGVTSLVWERYAEGWRIIADHSS